VLDALLVPLVTAAAGRLVKALVTGDDAETAGALSASLVKALFAQSDTTTAAIEAVSAQVEDVRETLWRGPYLSGMDQLEKSGRPGVTPEHRADLLQKAGARFADAKGSAPKDPAIAAVLDVHYALVWIAEGRIALAKDHLALTASQLEEAILRIHVTAGREMTAWTRFRDDRLRDSSVESMARYALGTGLFSAPPPDPRDPGGSYLTLMSLTRDHAGLQRLRITLHTAGDPFPVSLAAPLRRHYDTGSAAVVVDQPRHVTSTTFGVTTMVSLAPHGPNRAVTFTLHNDRSQAVDVRAAATADPAEGATGSTPTVVPAGGTLSSEQAASIVLSEAEAFVLELGVPTAGGTARVLVPFVPETEPFLAGFHDHRALEAARRATTPD
jgi:hypothetical protein